MMYAVFYETYTIRRVFVSSIQYAHSTRCGVRAWLITYRMFEIVGDLIEREKSDTTNTLNYYQFDETDKYIERKEPILYMLRNLMSPLKAATFL